MSRIVVTEEAVQKARIAAVQAKAQADAARKNAGLQVGGNEGTPPLDATPPAPTKEVKPDNSFQALMKLIPTDVLTLFAYLQTLHLNDGMKWFALVSCALLVLVFLLNDRNAATLPPSPTAFWAQVIISLIAFVIFAGAFDGIPGTSGTGTDEKVFFSVAGAIWALLGPQILIFVTKNK